MSLKEAVLSGEFITVQNFQKVIDTLEQFGADEVMQYNLTPTWLLDEYRIAEYKDTSIIYKLKPFVQYNIAQIEMIPNLGSLEEIHNFVDEVHGLGMHVRVTENQLEQYKLKEKYKWKLVDIAGGDFVYSTDNNHSLQGKTWASTRTGINRIEKNEDLTVEFKKPSQLTSLEEVELLELIEEYRSYKKESGNKTGFTFHLKKYVNNFRKWKPFDDRFAIQLIRYKGNIRAFSISEMINKHNVSLPDRKSMLHELPSMQHAFRAMNWLDINYWVSLDEGKKLNTHFNFGSAGDSKALYETKTRLKPALILKNYKFKEPKELDKDIQDVIRPPKKKKRTLW